MTTSENSEFRGVPRDVILQGNALEVLSTLADGSVDCCVTSPPYYGLRDYGTSGLIWGAKLGCEHNWVSNGGRSSRPDRSTGESDAFGSGKFSDLTGRGTQDAKAARGSAVSFGDTCSECGAWFGSFGLEPTPELYVCHIVEIFREVRRVLKDAGTLWLNLGDSYANDGKWGGSTGGKHAIGLHGATGIGRQRKTTGLKQKDLIGIPWMVAFALRADGWYLRQDIIWHKPNPMPESVTDRCTKAHEYIFLLSKSKHYYYDNESIKEPLRESSLAQISQDIESQAGSLRVPGKTNGARKAVVFGGANKHEGYGDRRKSGKEWKPNMGGAESGTANKRSVWSVTTQPYAEAHFATFPPKLIIPCIKAGCPEGGIVLDPFMGAGTTGFVAKKLFRCFLGIELNPEYIEIAMKRINGINPTLFEATE